MIKSFALNGDSRQMTSDTVAMRPAMHAARAVFNTVGYTTISDRTLELSLTDHTA